MFIDRITIKYMEILNYIKGYLNTKGHILNIYDIDKISKRFEFDVYVISKKFLKNKEYELVIIFQRESGFYIEIIYKDIKYGEFKAILKRKNIDETISVYGIDEDEEDLFRYWNYKTLRYGGN